MKRESARAIIIENNKVLTVFRRKIDEEGNVKEYYVIPGGGIEEGETNEETVVRELKEELGLEINILGYIGVVEKDKTIEHYFHVERVNGEPTIGGPEKEKNCDSNYYEPRFVKITELSKLDFQGIDLIEKAIKKEYVNKI